MTDDEPAPVEVDVPALAAAAEHFGTVEDVQRLGRLVRCRDTEADRAHLRLLIVRAQEEVAPGPPEVLEATARTVVASMRGTSLRRTLR